MRAPSQLDRFAEALAASAGREHDGNVAEIARRMGLDPARGNSLMQQLRRQVGREQAC
jgi:hypothetical protein